MNVIKILYSLFHDERDRQEFGRWCRQNLYLIMNNLESNIIPLQNKQNIM